MTDSHSDTSIHTLNTTQPTNQPNLPDQSHETLEIITLNIRGLRKKTEHIKNLITTRKPDFFILQETNINTKYHRKRVEGLLQTHIHKIYWSFDKHKRQSRGVAIIQLNDNWTVDEHEYDDIGRLVKIQIRKEKSIYNLYGIYGPAKHIDKENFYKNLNKRLKTVKDRNIILAGDFNATLDPLDSSKDDKFRESKNEEFQYVVETNRLYDTYRRLYPLGRDTTYTAHNQTKTRLDRVLATENIQTSRVQHITSTLAFTDHKAVHTTFGNPTKTPYRKKQSAFWKFNNSLLENKTYTDRISHTINEHIADITDDTDLIEWWELLKKTIKNMTIHIATNIQRQNRELEKVYRDYLADNDNGKEEQHIQGIKDKLNQIQQNKYTGNLIRCTHKLRTNTIGTPTDTIKSLEANIQKNRNITEIENNKGEIVTDEKGIREAFEGYYTDLYKYEHTDEDIEDKYAKHAKRLTDEQKETLDSEITVFDIQSTIQKLNQGKSPGPDGLTAEFYKFFSKLLVDPLKKLFDYLYEHQTLTPSQTLAYITIIPKTKQKSTRLKDFRPLSLLNVDYKIITKTLADKIKPFLVTLVHTDQTCAIPGRNIEENTHLIRDMIDYAQFTKTHTNILSIDQEKAFDRVAHTYIHKTLIHNNIGEYFRQWIKIIYSKPKSRVIVNQTLSDQFPIRRSVRQGCPLSAILYTLCLENFLESVRKDPNITGTKIPGDKNKKITAYADDTTFFPKDEKSIKNIIDKFQEFGRGSGAKVNKEKSKCMRIGGKQVNKEKHLGIEWVEEIKILGIKYKKFNKQLKKRLVRNHKKHEKQNT